MPSFDDGQVTELDTESGESSGTEPVDNAAENESQTGVPVDEDAEASSLADGVTEVQLQQHQEMMSYLDYMNTGLLVQSFLVAVILGVLLVRFFYDRVRA